MLLLVTVTMIDNALAMSVGPFIEIDTRGINVMTATMPPIIVITAKNIPMTMSRRLGVLARGFCDPSRVAFGVKYLL